jgi:A/G-specific adenine glycosylase
MPKAIKTNTPTSRVKFDFASTLCAWQKIYGRHDLPWQLDLSPYPVWLSEIMLQQTQVKTVIEYFDRFMTRFPSVEDLASATEDEVLSMWSGLGYYSRARNLHQCAKDVVHLHGGQFPRTLDALMSLPGIGPSTAAAIASICFSSKVAIFDGNVKRVISRFMAFKDDLSVALHSKTLAMKAQELLPKEQTLMPTYTQAIMDLGATICKPKNPLCESCPVAPGCSGKAQGDPSLFPVKTKKIKRTQRRLFWLIALDGEGRVLGVKRSAEKTSGIWKGLYAFPEFESESALRLSLPSGVQLDALEPIRHELTHQSLVIEAFVWREKKSSKATQTLSLAKLQNLGQWMDSREWSAVGVPRPVEAFLNELM